MSAPLEPLWMQRKTTQMGSNPHAILNHHMKLLKLASCQVTSPSDKVQSHDDCKILHLGCYSKEYTMRHRLHYVNHAARKLLATEFVPENARHALNEKRDPWSGTWGANSCD